MILQGPESYTDYLVTAKLSERLQVTKQAAQKIDEERLKSQEAKCVGSLETVSDYHLQETCWFRELK